MRYFRNPLCRLAALVFLAPAFALGHGAGAGAEIQVRPAAVVASPFGVQGELAAPAPGVADLKFRDFFRLPVGPRGLAPSAKLQALDGKRVRLLGYMVDREQPAPGLLILAPLPVSIAEIEDGPADDMPAAVAYVHFDGPADRALPYLPGLLQFTGTLSVGAREEADGRVSVVRLQLDAAASRALRQLGEQALAASR
jgi:hypothetical protein